MVLLDTDICIYLLNQRPGFESILMRLDGREHGKVNLSAITLAELRFGIAASHRRTLNLAKLELFLASFEVVAFDDRAAAAYGPLRAYLKAQGTPIGPLDTLIAAHTVSLGASLVTNNVRVWPCARSHAGELAGIDMKTGRHIGFQPQQERKGIAVYHRYLSMPRIGSPSESGN